MVHIKNKFLRIHNSGMWSGIEDYKKNLENIK